MHLQPKVTNLPLGKPVKEWFGDGGDSHEINGHQFTVFTQLPIKNEIEIGRKISVSLRGFVGDEITTKPSVKMDASFSEFYWTVQQISPPISGANRWVQSDNDPNIALLYHETLGFFGEEDDEQNFELAGHGGNGARLSLQADRYGGGPSITKSRNSRPVILHAWIARHFYSPPILDDD